jgi:hypothetical protein
VPEAPAACERCSNTRMAVPDKFVEHRLLVCLGWQLVVSGPGGPMWRWMTVERSISSAVAGRVAEQRMAGDVEGGVGAVEAAEADVEGRLRALGGVGDLVVAGEPITVAVRIWSGVPQCWSSPRSVEYVLSRLRWRRPAPCRAARSSQDCRRAVKHAPASSRSGSWWATPCRSVRGRRPVKRVQCSPVVSTGR